MSRRIPSKPWWTVYTDENIRRYFMTGVTLVGAAIGVYYWSILDTAKVVKEENMPGSKVWQEKQEWKKIKAPPSMADLMPRGWKAWSEAVANWNALLGSGPHRYNI